MTVTASSIKNATFPSNRRLITDPDNIGWPLFIVFPIASTIDHIVWLNTKSQTTQDSLFAFILGVVSTSAVLWVARVFILRWRLFRDRVIPTVFVLFLCVTTGTQIGQSQSSVIGVDRIILGTALLVTTIWIVGLLRAYRMTSSELLGIQQQMVAARAASENAMRHERTEIITPIIERLTLLIHEIVGLSPAIAAKRMRAVSEQLVRPASHELAELKRGVSLPAQQIPKPAWRKTLVEVASSPLILPKTMAAVMVVLVSRLTVLEASSSPHISPSDTVQVSVDWPSLLRAVAQLFLTFAVVWMCATVTQSQLQRLLISLGPTLRWIITLTSIPVVAFSSQLIMLGLLSIPGLSPDGDQPLADPKVFIIPLTIIAALTGAQRATHKRLMNHLEELRTLNTELSFTVARLNEQLWRQRRSFSKQLHGTVQANLNAAAIITSRSGETIPGEVIERLHHVIEQLADEHHESIDIATEILQLQQTWQGICQIEITVSPAVAALVQSDPVCATAFVDIVSEASANAVIHGKATQVAVVITRDSHREIRIEATDNGTGTALRNGGGLGSALLKEACTIWGLEPHPDGTRLYAVIPVETTPIS